MSTGERADFQIRASAILASLIATRDPWKREEHREQWALMWSLVREAVASGAKFQLPPAPRWEYEAYEVDEAFGVIRPMLTGGGPAVVFELQISYPPDKPEDSYLATELPKFLNWADVPVPGEQH